MITVSCKLQKWGHQVLGQRVVHDPMKGHRVLAQMQAANMNRLQVHIHQPPMPVRGQLGLMQAADIHGGHMLVSIPQHLMRVSTLPGQMRVGVLLRLT